MKGSYLIGRLLRSYLQKAILAGGLTPENLPTFDNILGYDVSGGVETNGVKDH